MQLECSSCGTTRALGSVHYRCSGCGGDLVVRLDRLAPPEPARRGVWRYHGRLPVDPTTEPVSLGEGETPLVDITGATANSVGAARIAMKCEQVNPTGSFKDRIASVAVTIARERSLTGLAGTSSGNGGAAAAAYAARAGLPLRLFALASIPEEKLVQLRALGAEVYLMTRIGFDAATTDATASAVASYSAAHNVFPFITGGRFSPEAMEGAKTIAYELSEQEPAATAVYVPVGGGGLLAAVWRGYAELHGVGARVPRLVAVQPSGCATLQPALNGDFSGLDGPVTTSVSGLQVATLFDRGAVDAVRQSGGRLVEVSDNAIRTAQRVLARESGLLVEPAGATAFAGVLADAVAGRIGPDDRIVVIGTGAGSKDGQALRLIADPTTPRTISINDIEGILL